VCAFTAALSRSGGAVTVSCALGGRTAESTSTLVVTPEGQSLQDSTPIIDALEALHPEPSVHPDLLKVPNVVLTPHIASSTIKTRMAMAQLAADNLVAYLTRGQALTPLNTVTGPAA
jgi:hypothetical protein